MMLTDGLTELRQDKEGCSTFLGHEGLTVLAQQSVSAALAQQSTLRQSGQAILDQAKAFCGGAHFTMMSVC